MAITQGTTAVTTTAGQQPGEQTMPNRVSTGGWAGSAGSLTLGLCLALAFSACKKPKPPPPAPPVVQVITISPQDVPIYKEWIGTLDGMVNAQIRAEVSGYLLSQNYTEGSEVKKGELLFGIDPRPFQAVLDQAKSKLAQDQAQESRTKWDVDRYAPLAKQNAISQQEYNDAVQSNLAAQAQVKADEATVEAAQLNLGFTRITSPIEGLAGLAQAQIGDLVGPNGPVLTTVSTINPIKVYFTASEQAYLAYRRQYTNAVERTTHEQELELQLILADGSTYQYPGKFYFAGREVSATTGTIQLAGLFPNPGYVLRPGQFARVRARTETRKNAILVPQRAVAELQGSYQVDVVDETNKVHVQNVKVGEQLGSDWLIEKGLSAGERIIVEGTQKVTKDGITVNPQPYSNTNRTAVAANP
jgi:membrane fusion protein (multidrug efflux system)